MTERAKKLLLLYYKQSRKIRRVSGLPPLTFKAKKAGTLKNYRIYGQTVDGESVGDRTGNLFDENSQSVPGYIDNYGNIVVLSYPITTYDFISVDASAAYTYRAFNAQDTSSDYINLRVAFYNSGKAFIGRYFNDNVTLRGNTLTMPDDCRYVRLSVDDNLADIMFIEGATIPTNYEPYGYRVPVTVSNGTDTLTTPIYLPEPIKMIGDEAEYIDYAEQKQHRVRKNLFSTELEQGNISTDGTLVDSESRLRTKNYLPCEKGDYVLSFSGENIKFGCRLYDANYDIIVSTSWMEKNRVFSIDRINTKYIKLNFAKNNITENISPSDITDIQLEKGSTATEYEPYIENTDLDVNLPALPVLPGTNTLTVGTEVQPSGVEIKGRIKAAGGD